MSNGESEVAQVDLSHNEVDAAANETVLNSDGPDPPPSTQPQADGDAAEEASDQSVKKRKQIATRSEVWDHFEKFFEKNKQKGRCKYCGKVYNADPKVNGTSNMLKHMKDCGKGPFRNNAKQPKLSLQRVEGCEGMGTLGTWTYSEDAIREAIVLMIVIDELPFKFVEGEGFKFLMMIICPNFTIPSRWTISRDCNKLYLSEREKLQVELISNSGRICLTTNTWTSLQRINYMCVTAHWIDDEWNLTKKIISFIPITSHRGDDIATALEACMNDWGLKNIFAVTVDNASSNDVAMTRFKQRVSSWGTAISQGSYLHMRCIAHILNLVVNDGLKDMTESIKKVRDCVRWFRNSPSRLKSFYDTATYLNVDCEKSLRLDVPTRWNSTFLMLETACKYERVFEKFATSDHAFKNDLLGSIPTFLDWETIRKFSKCLSHFYDLTIKVSGSLYVTANFQFPEIVTLHTLLTEMSQNSDIEIQIMATNM